MVRRTYHSSSQTDKVVTNKWFTFGHYALSLGPSYRPPPSPDTSPRIKHKGCSADDGNQLLGPALFGGDVGYLNFHEGPNGSASPTANKRAVRPEMGSRFSYSGQGFWLHKACYRTNHQPPRTSCCCSTSVCGRKNG